MKKHWYLIYIVFCLYLLISIPGTAESAGSNEAILSTQNADAASKRSIIISPKAHEFTLIFKKTAVISDLYLTTPDEVKRSLAKEDNGILATSNYEVVQIKSPMQGEWLLSGPASQLEQVLILTDVGLGTNFVSGIYFNGELLTLSGYLEQGTQAIKSDMAVEGLKINFELKNSSHNFPYVIPHDKDGLFTNTFILNVPEGTYQAIWNAQGTYLSKSHEYKVKIKKNPFEQVTNAQHDSLMIQLQRPELIKTETVAVKMFYKDVPANIPITTVKEGWIANFYSLCQKHSFSEDNVLIEITAKTTHGRALLFKLLLNDEVCSPDYKPAPVVDPKAEQLLKEKELKKQKQFKRLLLIIVSIAGAIALAVTIFLVLWRLKKRKKNDRDNS